MIRPSDQGAIDKIAILNAPWYHSIDLPGGITTPGRYDLRPIVDRLPWPELRDARCLDVGGRDGFLAFEMERRGAAEVVSLDIEDPDDIEFPGFRPLDEQVQDDLDNGRQAFELARAALGSTVRRQHLSIYDVRPETVGTFDFAVVGTLLLHLRDPVAALSALNGILNGFLLVNEAINVSVDLFRRRPIAEAVMVPGRPFWWLPNPAGLARLLVGGGFEVVASGRPYMVPNGAGALRRPWLQCFRPPLRDIPRNIVNRRGALHYWVVGRRAQLQQNDGRDAV